MYEALDEWGVIAKDAGITKAALAYRWITYHSALGKDDGVVVGASKFSQLEETLKAIDAGPLNEETARRVNVIWEKVKTDAPRDNWNDWLAHKL